MKKVNLMRRKNQKLIKPDINISPPRISSSRKSILTELLLSTILAASGVYGTLWCVISAFSLPVNSHTLNLYTLIFVLFFTSVYFLKKLRSVILILSSLVYCISIWYFKFAVVQGFIITTNQILKVFSDKSDLSFPKYIVSVKAELYPNFCTLFLLFVSFIISYYICFSAVKKKSFWLTFLVTFPFLLSAVIFEITPNFFTVLLLFLCWTILVLIKLPILSANNKKINLGNAVGTKIGIISIPAVILCFALILTFFPRESYRRTQNTQQLQDKLDNIFIKNQLFKGNVLSENTKDVNLKDKGNIEFSGKTMLKIKSNTKYPFYLKSYAGSIYNGQSWKELPKTEYDKINNGLYGMNVQNMSYIYFSLLGQQNSPRYRPDEIRVKNIGASKRCIYAPYNLRTLPENITGVNFINDAFIRSNYIFGTSEYSLYAYGIDKEKAYLDIPGMLLNISDGKFKYSPSWNRYFSRLKGINKFSSSEDIESYYKTKLDSNLLKLFNENQSSFILAEQNYRNFMYDKYTQLPKETKDKVEKLLKDTGISKGSYSFNDIISRIKLYLKNNYSYTLSPGETPEDRDFAEYFLFENHKGYCVHFATAGTVMLRAMGIPARYAEGYAVTEEDYKLIDNDGWANIRDNRAHAWTEVYYSGLGWQPIEMTPGGNAGNNNFRQDISQSSQPVSSNIEAEKAESKIESKTESEKQKENKIITQNQDLVSDTRFSFLPAIFIITSIFLIFAGLALKRKIIIVKRKKVFSLEDKNKAVLYVYAYLEKLLKFGGEISKEVNDIALKARFSRHNITDEELDMVIRFTFLKADQNYNKLTKIQKFIFKYIYNLI